MAIEQRIIKRRRPRSVAVAAATDFLGAQAEEITLRSIFAKASTARTVSPYALDTARREVTFVRTSEDVDLASAAPRFHEAQRGFATHVITAPFDEVLDAARVLGTSRMRFAFLYSAGHSGATITARIADALPGVQTLIEPDIFTHVTLARGRAPADAGAGLSGVLAASASLLATHREAVDPAHPMLLLKLRGRATFAAPEIRKALPTGRAMYMHRHPADVVDSYVGDFFDHTVARIARRLGLDRLFVRAMLRVLPYTHPWVPAAMPLLFERRARGERSNGAVETVALVLHSMRLEFERLRAGADARLCTVLRYEDLKSDGPRFVKRIARGLGVRVDHVDVLNALRAAHDDVDPATQIATRKRPSLSPRDVARLESTLARLEAYMEPAPLGAA